METIHDYIVGKLRGDWKGRWDEVSQKTGVPVRTIEKVAARVYKSHRLSTMDPLHSFFREQDRKPN